MSHAWTWLSIGEKLCPEQKEFIIRMKSMEDL